MTPRLVKWDKEYREKGLTIIDVDNGKRDTRKDLEAYVEKHGKAYPTLWDADAKVCTKYGIKGYPAAFLIGVEGKVIWEGWPNPEIDEVEKLMLAELKKVELVKTGDEPARGEIR